MNILSHLSLKACLNYFIIKRTLTGLSYFAYDVIDHSCTYLQLIKRNLANIEVNMLLLTVYLKI